MSYGEYVFRNQRYTRQELLQKRAHFVDTMEGIINAAKHANRDLTREEVKELDKLQAKIDAVSMVLGDGIFRDLDLRTPEGIAEAHDRLDQPAGEPWRPGMPVGGEFPRELREGEVIALTPQQSLAEFVRMRGTRCSPELARAQDTASFGRMVQGLITGDWSGAEPELRVLAQAGLGSAGWWTVPEITSARLIDLARNQSVCMRAGALTIPMDGPEVTVTKVVTDPTAYWRAEHAAIPESSMSFEPLKLKALALAVLCRVSIEQMQDSQNFGAVLEGAIAAALALEMDRAMLFGSGAGEPRGLVNTEGINEQSMGENGAALTSYDPFSFAYQAVLTANGTPRAVVMAPRTWGSLDRLKEATTGSPLRPPASYEALAKFTSNQIPTNLSHGTASNASLAIVGDFSQLALASLTDVSLAIATQGEVFPKMEVMIRGFIRADVAVLRPNHFCKITGIL